MESLFNQAISFSIFGGILAISGVMVWLRNNHNAFNSVLDKVSSLKTFNAESTKVQKQLIEDVVYLRSQVLKHKTEIDLVQDYNAKIKDQMQILSRRQKYLKEKMIPNKIQVQFVNDDKKKKNPLEGLSDAQLKKYFADQALKNKHIPLKDLIKGL